LDVSIVIPTKNAGPDFKNVLDAIFAQETGYKFEVICVDSGSKDGTTELIRSYPCALYEIDPSDFGHGKTRNYGASLGTGDYIIFVTHDALPVNNTWLQNLVDALKTDDSVVGGFGAHYPYPDCNVLDARDISAHFARFGSETKVMYIDNKERYQNDKDYYHLMSFFSDNNSCIRRDIWQRYPYPEVKFAEDQIWMRAMLEKGYKKVYCPEAPVYHSHNFSLREYFSRYYDEHQAVYGLFGQYLIVDRWYKVPFAAARSIAGSFLYVLSLDLSLGARIKAMHYCIWRQIYRYVGGYLGGKSNLYSPEKRERYDRRFSQQYRQKNSQ
jgi:rhamnosyltransferase